MAQAQTDPKMNFFNHVDELRVRILRCLWVFFLGFIACYFISDYLLDFLRAPLFEALPEDKHQLYFTSLFENFLTHLKISGYASLFLFSPFYFYQLWAFVAPGLHKHERKMAFPFISAATLFFIGGAAFAYYVLFPVGFKFFVEYGTDAEVPLLTIASYYSTCMRLLLLFGIAFELPVLICLLGYLGVVDAAMLRQHRNGAIIGITVIAALFAPPDAISMIMLGVPLVLLYEASIYVVAWLGKNRAKHSESEKNDSLEGQSR